MDKYCKEVIRKYEEKHNITIKKENIPISVDTQPEMDTSDILDENGHRDFQHIIGVGQ